MVDIPAGEVKDSRVQSENRHQSVRTNAAPSRINVENDYHILHDSYGGKLNRLPATANGTNSRLNTFNQGLLNRDSVPSEILLDAVHDGHKQITEG